ncbi:helix-turn-helix transcriptional regulator [Streptomyces sp. NPDC005574]|uniref:helix-turn-helix domain-containing protein n=1 Tax=Streptomyces sp. NPDC005574 TaxID=3156891 RepID=UPI0033B52AFB
MATYLPIPGDAPEAVQALASQLRDAKEAAGLSVAKLATKAHFSTATISLAASGKKVPTWPVTWAFVEACEDTKGQAHWEALWSSADAAEKGQTDDETEAPDPAPTSAKRSRTRRKSVDELVDEAVNRLRANDLNPELDRTRSQLELCISAEQFCNLLRGARGSLTIAEIKEKAHEEGFITLRKFDIATMTSENSNTIPEIQTLQAFLVGCEVEAGLRPLWINTATRLQLMQAWRAQPRDQMNLRRRMRRRWGRALGGLRLEALITLICTVILTAAQIYQLTN